MIIPSELWVDPVLCGGKRSKLEFQITPWITGNTKPRHLHTYTCNRHSSPPSCSEMKFMQHKLNENVTSSDDIMGAIHLSKNFGIFGSEGKWNSNFRNVHFENFGQPLEVVNFSEISELPGIFCSIWHFSSVRPPHSAPVSFPNRCRRQDGGIALRGQSKNRFVIFGPPTGLGQTLGVLTRRYMRNVLGA